MLEDRYLIWRLRRGSRDALCRIYDKYRADLLRLAVSLPNETTMAEDVVQDVFVAFFARREMRVVSCCDSCISLIFDRGASQRGF